MGDEYHILLECSDPILTKIRSKFNSKLMTLLPQFNQFTNISHLLYIFCMQDSSIIFLVGKYVLDILKHY